MTCEGNVTVTVIDMGTGRSANVEAGGDTVVKDTIARAREMMGEIGRASDRYFDDRGNPLDSELDKPVSTMANGQDGTITVEIRHPTGGGARRALGGAEASGDDAWDPQRRAFFAALVMPQWLLTRPCYGERQE